ncbi:hypothetical protein PJWF_00035 [Achromobacter phage JWF]|uniref:hypothetical protein n=1 Tax=Achromobacter phage JWF TaxID=1589748 RepID=UPI000588DF84|nr:hypothetical protein AXJ13_gp035 [Achromobacter phage JWF]AJD82929.1 hypothetical protein PJWF_00035 [Achromobacter phage JWF]
MKMISLQTTIIAAAIALAVGGIGGLVSAWSLTRNHYIAKIESERSAASEAARIAEAKFNTTVANLKSASSRELNEVSTALQEKLNAAEKINDDYARRIATGSLVLRDPGASRPRQVSQDRSCPAASQRDGQTGSELSTEASQFLWGEAERADRNTEELSACQAVAASYWQLINKYGLEIEALTATMMK